jgi:hypothetical protein
LTNFLQNGVETSKEFELDGAYNTKHTQDAVFQDMGPNIAETLMRGFNCTLVLDGFPQTGKTYTMIGEGTEFGIEVKESDGLLPRLVRLVFDHILDTAEDTTEFTIGVSTYAMVRKYFLLTI